MARAHRKEDGATTSEPSTPTPRSSSSRHWGARTASVTPSAAPSPSWAPWSRCITAPQPRRRRRCAPPLPGRSTARCRPTRPDPTTSARPWTPRRPARPARLPGSTTPGCSSPIHRRRRRTPTGRPPGRRPSHRPHRRCQRHLLCHPAPARKAARGGRRVEQGSVPRRAEPPAYAFKARMNALGQSRALVPTPHEILIGTMAPGFVETERAREVLDGELERLRTRALAGRLAPATRTTPSSPAARLPCRAARCRGAGRRGPVAGWSSAGTADSPHPAGRRPGGSCRPPSAGRP